MSRSDADREKLLRIIDANLNRAGEAARVVEDCARFVLDHPGLTHCAKGLRHRLHMSAASMGIHVAELLTARDTEGDVGTELVEKSELERVDLGSVLRANFQRLEQSLRVLEEYAKLLEAGDAGFEAIRYDVYTLEKAFATPPARPASLAEQRLMVLIGGGPEAQTMQTAEQVLEGGCRLIELREKTLSDADCLALARRLRALTTSADAALIVNDRVDVAKGSGADGVHLGRDDVPIEHARRILGPSKLVGLTAHTIDELTDAEARGADYIGVGTMFRSPTKPDLEVKGPTELIPATLKCRVPCYAIGGITRHNLDELIALGAMRVSVGSGITAADDIVFETDWFLGKLP